MKVQKILFITSQSVASTSSASIRNKNLLLGFLDMGVNITLICPESEESLDNIFEGKNNKIEFITYELHSNLKQLKEKQSSSTKGLSKSFLKLSLKIYRKFSILKMAGQTLKYTDNIDLGSSNFDLVITSSDPIASHVFFEKIKSKVSYDRWCQYWGDPLANDITNTMLIPKWILKYYERRILNRADSIVYVSPFTLKLQRETYPKLKGKMHFIPPAGGSIRLFEKHDKNNDIIISYTGGYNSLVRDIMPLYNAVFKSSNRSLKLVISGSSDISVNSTENITINGTVSLDKVEDIESESDLIVVIMNNNGTQIPSKLYYTALTNKDILVLVNNEGDSMYKYLKDFARYHVCLNNEVSILNYFNNLTKNNLGQRNPLLSLNSKKIAESFLKVNNTSL